MCCYEHCGIEEGAVFHWHDACVPQMALEIIPVAGGAICCPDTTMAAPPFLLS